MKFIKRDLATSFTTILFVIISVSGVMMFFHFFDTQVKSLHEILGLVFVGAALFHVIFNWSSMKRYFAKKVFFLSFTLLLAISSFFVVQSLNQKENPKGVLIEKMLSAPFKNSLDVLHVNYDDAIDRLNRENISIETQESIQKIAQTNKTSPFRIVAILIQE
ncbi:MAG TPA: hypothetical protein CFH79_10490 [Sulfurospirillum sp. UBA11407]|jgi:hypothetical protein|nr:MAG TPA: hypothetical protein CFH79_10490 [Sulfurospirillum sp. UBA11407]DAB35375.1 MAG TPA: hypothetical protein CFH82_00555 [Sulfurospirillum sp. UBA12182]